MIPEEFARFVHPANRAMTGDAKPSTDDEESGGVNQRTAAPDGLLRIFRTGTVRKVIEGCERRRISSSASFFSHPATNDNAMQ